ncbi:hypothetical protein [Bacillus cereus]|uniref:Uncharacterized protein n=1 Tax=Bacillus cereus TaxID=1396 RepID=A0A9X7M1Z6_BACCE|nr:hypothetical protein [Bacillus cereus]QDZ77072.1 hypothetical protein D0437_30470 [Bacillus cereus]
MFIHKYKLCISMFITCLLLSLPMSTTILAASPSKTFNEALADIKNTHHDLEVFLTAPAPSPDSDTYNRYVSLVLTLGLNTGYDKNGVWHASIPINSLAERLFFYLEKFENAAEQIKLKKDNTKEQIIQYDVIFQDKYKGILNLADQNNSKQIVTILNELQEELLQKQKIITKFQQELTAFQNTPNGQNYPTYIKNQVILPQITEYESEKRQLEAAMDPDPNSLSGQMDRANIDMLQSLKINPLNEFIDTLDRLSQPIEDFLSSSVNNVQNQWFTINASLTNIIKNINETQTIDAAFIRAEIGTAQNTWNKIIKIVNSEW